LFNQTFAMLACFSPTNTDMRIADGLPDAPVAVVAETDPVELELGVAATEKHAAEGKSVFEFAKINFVVKAKKAPGGVRRILTDVGARVRSGRVLAIMGPSGAGSLFPFFNLVFKSTRRSEDLLTSAHLLPPPQARRRSSTRSRCRPSAVRSFLNLFPVLRLFQRACTDVVA
jgi:hypothetical protein